jgi:hypothetical protein
MNSKDIDFQDIRKPASMWVNWELDEQGLSLIAYRAYGHILRRAGGKGHAWPSYQSIGDTCFSADSNSPRTRRDWAIKAIKELCDRQLLRKALRVSDDQKRLQSNLYQITDKDDWLTPSRSTTTTPSRSTTTTPSRSTTTVSNSILSNSNIEVVQGQSQEIHTANDRGSEIHRLDSNTASPSPLLSGKQPTTKQPPTEKKGFERQEVGTTPSLSVDPDPETINRATQQQCSVSCAEPIKSEEGDGAAQKTRKLVYGGKGVMAITNLVQLGINKNWWNGQQELAAFQWAIFAAKEQSGYSQPARAITAIFTALERKDVAAIEEIAGYWARYDQATQTIAPKQSEPMPWVKDGQVIPAYASWVKSNDRWLDGQLPDGTYKINLILTTTKSNKFARDAWEKYQETLKADEVRKRRSEEMANEVYEPELPPLTDEQKARAEAIWLKVAELKAKRNAKAS